MMKLLATRALPALLFAAATAFYIGIAIQQANPPVMAVQGNSMRPSLSDGDLVLLKGVPPAALRKGEIIVVEVSGALQARDHLPPDLEHRIVGVEHTPHGLRLMTKGDANSKRDPFEVRPQEILGQVTGSIPLLGYVFLFFGSVPGDVFLVFLAVAASAFFLARWRSRRRACIQRWAGTILALREDADEIRASLAAGREFRAPTSAGLPQSPTPADLAANPSASGKLERATSALENLVTEVRATSSQSRDSAAMLRELVGAVSEYGVHLRSHTAVMRNLAATTTQLQEAATRLADALANGSIQGRPTAAGQGGDAAADHPAPNASGSEPEERDAARPRVIDAESWREPFTSSELRWPNLTRTDEGYLAEPVDRLLDRAADALDIAERERSSLRDRLQVVETRLAMLSEDQEAIVQTRLAQAEVRREAEREAQAAARREEIREAERRAEAAALEEEGRRQAEAPEEEGRRQAEAERDVQLLDVRARQEVTLALQEATRRAAEIAREVEEERRSLLELITRELGGHLVAASSGLGDEAAFRVLRTPRDSGTEGDRRPVYTEAAPAPAPAPPAAPAPAPPPAPPAAPPAAPAPAPPPPQEAARPAPPSVPPVWDVTPSPGS